MSPTRVMSAGWFAAAAAVAAFHPVLGDAYVLANGYDRNWLGVVFSVALMLGAGAVTAFDPPDGEGPGGRWAGSRREGLFFTGGPCRTKPTRTDSTRSVGGRGRR